jgi:inhibitor of cysteine peptidase
LLHEFGVYCIQEGTMLLNRTRILGFAVLVAALVVLGGCERAGGPVESPIATPTGAPASSPGADTEVLVGQAAVQTVDLLLLESFPVQVNAIVRGSLPDGCTTIDQVTQTREGNALTVTITTARPADKMCTQLVTPFEQNVPLEVAGLPAGTYTVDVNGTTSTFTLDVDNVLK